MIKNENELSVSSKFDVKEQVFPRPLFVLSQEDEIHFLFKTYSEQDFLVNSIWISPNGDIHHVNRNSLVNATSGYLLDKVSPTTSQCTTGIWTILCYGEDMNIIDTVEFVILPSIRTNKVSCNFSVKNDLKLMSIEEEMVLPIIIQKEEKDHRFMKAIKAWIETKYHIEDVCFDKESPGNSRQLCSTKYWSSIGHDPFESNNL